MVTFWAWPLEAPNPMRKTPHNMTSRFAFTIAPLPNLRKISAA
jgi:hypothetical protein